MRRALSELVNGASTVLIYAALALAFVAEEIRNPKPAEVEPWRAA